jgi:lactoylglutathione lyase
MRIDYPITFLYYKDLGAVIPFYEDVLGLKLFVDQGWCKIFKINASSCVGLVDETRGSLRATPDKAVLLTLVVDDVIAWHEHLTARGVHAVTPVKTHESIGVTAFTCKDPGGYLIEVQKFL